MTRLVRTAVAAAIASSLVDVPAATDDRAAVAQPTATARFEHRVVVSTTSLDREQDVEGSLERNVNALAAVGYELTAFVGGDAGVLDQLLKRRAYVAGLVDHAGLTFAVMARPVDRPVAAREYRLLHTRTGFGVDRLVAPLGAAGFRMSVGAFDGDVTHLAFERTGTGPAVELRVFRNKGRRAWMDLALADADVMRRITRVFPIALDAAVIELGTPQPSPGDLKWLSRGYTGFEALEAPLKDLARGGYRVELVRARRNELDVLVVRPAGATSSAARYDLDDGPWGGPCSRGRLAGAAVQPDGDVACVADLAAEATNRGLDLTVRAQASAGGQMLFRGPDCDIRARLLSTRPAAPRVAFAVQMEREIDSAIAAGHRVVRAFAARDSNGQMRIVGMTSDERADPPTGPAVTADPGPPLVPELDTLGDDLRRQREARLNTALARSPRSTGTPLWMELAGSRSARLLGCVISPLDRDQAASAARGLLVKEGLADYALDNRVIVER